MCRSGDATARIWDTDHGNASVTLPHVLPGNPDPEKTKDVTTLDWNVDGSLLATGSYDGCARIWNSSGASLHGPHHVYHELHLYRDFIVSWW